MQVRKFSECYQPVNGDVQSHSKVRLQHFIALYQYLAVSLVTALSLITVSYPALADDTEIYFGQVPSDNSTRPNVLFLLDTSASMHEADSGQVGSRLERMQTAMREILDTSQDLNIGLMGLSGTNGGGSVLYPVRNIDEVICEGEECTDATLQSTISDANNDTEERLSDGESLEGGQNILMGNSGSQPRIIGYRFDNLNIPQGATITSAVLELEASENRNAFANLLISGELSDDSRAFDSSNADLQGRVKTTAAVPWNVTENWVENEVYDSADLKDIVQEVVAQTDWCGGNALSVFVTGSGRREVKSVEQVLNEAENEVLVDGERVIGNAPRLRVTYNLNDVVAGQGCHIRTVVSQVNAWRDDASERQNNGRTSIGTKLVYIPARSGGSIIQGMRFIRLAIPQGAEIEEARISLRVRTSRSDNVSIRITGEDSGDAASYSRENFSVSNRAGTAASVVWENLPVTAANTRIETPNIAPVVEEIVAGNDWSEGNALAIRLTNNNPSDTESHREFHSRDKQYSSAPRIVIRYKHLFTSSADTNRTVRQEIKSIVDGIGLTLGTPLLSAKYEAAQYLLGGPVTYADTRGKNVRSSLMRVSHPESYTGGALYVPEGCTTSNADSDLCRDEAIIQDGPEGAAIYTSPITHSCEATHLVMLSDGFPSGDNAGNQIMSFIGEDSCDTNASGEKCGTDLVRWLDSTDHNNSIDGIQNIKTHTVAFNLDADSTAYMHSIANAGGTGTFRTADSSEELVAVFRDILAGVSNVSSTFSAPAVTVNQFNRLTHREDLYFSLFQPDDGPIWPGNLKRFKVGSQDGSDSAEILDVNGDPAIDPETGFFSDDAHSFWLEPDGDGALVTFADGATVSRGGAATRIGVDGIDRRKVYTYLGDNAAIGTGVDLTADNQRLHENNALLTDALLGIENIYADDEARQSAYRQSLVKWIRGVDVLDDDDDNDYTESRRHMGDPMHSQPAVVNYRDGFDNDSSVVYTSTNEGMLHAIDADTGDELWAFSPAELLPNHRTFYQNTIGEPHPYGLDGPLSVWRNDPNNDLIVDVNEKDEKALLVMSMRRGGNNYYALDVTDRDAPKLAWVIEGGEDGTQGFEELGESWSQAIPTKILHENDVKDVLIFGAGYDTNQDPDNETSVMSQDEDAQGRGLFIVETETGELLWAALGVTGLSSKSQVFDDMDYGMAGNIQVVDIDGDGVANQLYNTDMGGQVWRFDFVNTNGDLLQGGVIADLSGPLDEDHRRLYNQPDVAVVAKNGERFLSISVGSGWRAHPLNTVVKDRFHMLKSTAIRSAPSGYGKQNEDGDWEPVTVADLSNSTSGTNTSNSPYGWYIDLPDIGEKVLSRSLTFDNVVFFSSYVPNTTAGLCQPSVGSGFAYALDIVDGGSIFDLNENGSIDDDSTFADKRLALKSAGIPGSPSILIPEQSKDPILLFGTEKVDAPLTNETTRTYWVDTGAID